MDLTKNDIFALNGPLVAAGAALHWLRPRSKAPIDNAWSIAPVATRADLDNSYTAGANVGIRLGEPSHVAGLYVHLIDLDIRDAAQAGAAWAKLLELWPAARDFPTVVSGSGGESRHVYFLCARPFRSKKLARSAGFKMVWDESKGRDVKKFDWEVELFGTNKQAVLPPSIHPDTGKPYVWVRAIDLEMLDLGGGPVLSPDLVREWTSVALEGPAEDGEVRPVLGLSEEEARKILADLPLDNWCDDRDGWLQAGMALHHEFNGSDVGLALWNEFSKRSTKFDAKDQGRVWRSFKDRPNSVRMATLKKAAQVARFEAMFDEADEPPPPKPLAGLAPGLRNESGLVEDDLMADMDEDDDDELAEDDSDDLLDDSGSGDPEIDALLGGGAPLVGAGSSGLDPQWRSKLDINEEGAFKPTLHNLELIVRNDPRTRGLAALNQFTQEIVMRGTPGVLKLAKASPKGTRQLVGPIWRLSDPINGDLWSDAHDDAIRSIIEAPKRQGGYALKVSDRDLSAAVNLVARGHSFHPVREYLGGLEWDGVERLDTLFIRFLGAEDNAYTRNISRLTLTAAVTRVFEPGHKYDFALILEGVQGKRKSTFIEILARHWFAELNGNFHDRKEMVEKMQGSWICELPELQGFGKAEVQDIKAFISARKDKVRLAYERRAKEFDRQSIMMGSTNDRRYLRDETGGRRFWPVVCAVASIDTDGLLAEVDQVWAEATAAYRGLRAERPTGTLPLYLSNDDAAAVAKRMQEDRRVETAEDAIAGKLSAWLEKPIPDPYGDRSDDLLDGPTMPRTETCLVELWVEGLGRDLRAYDNRAAQQLGRAMRDVEGWASDGEQHRFDLYGKQRAYRRLKRV